MKSLSCLFAILLIMLLAACSKPLEPLVNSNFPPATENEQRQRAIDGLVANLNNIKNPSIGVEIGFDALRSGILAMEGREELFTDVKIVGDDQLIRIEFDFQTKVPMDKAITLLPENTEATVQGNIILKAGLVDSFKQEDNEILLNIRVLPYVERLEVTNISLASKNINPEVVAKPLAEAVMSLANRLIIQFKDELDIDVQIPVHPFFKNPTDELEGTDEHQLRLVSNNLESIFFVNGLSILVQEHSLKALLDVAYIDSDLEEESMLVQDTVQFNDRLDIARKGYMALWEDTFDDDVESSDVRVLLNSGFLANTLNSLLNQSQACFLANTNSPQQITINETATLPPASEIDCTIDRDCRQTMDCTPKRDCTFVAQRDTRNCHACLLRNPFGGCILRGNDPACEVAKVAQNNFYQADAAARKADCERIKTQEKAGCELEKEAKRVACEAEKGIEKGACETLKTAYQGVLALGDDVAHIEGNVDFDATVKACLTNFAVNETLSSVSMTWKLTGQAVVDYAMRLEADGIAKLSCPLPAYPNGTLTASIQSAPVQITSALEFLKTNEGFGLQYKGKSGEIPYRLVPDPVSVFTQSWDLGDHIRCPIIAAATIPVQAAKAFGTRFEDEFKVGAELFDGFEPLDLPKVNLGQLSPIFEVSSNSKSLIIVGQIDAE
ncbi:hypothetical protein ACP3VU_17430 [Vibrio sp. PNB23_22_6]